MSEFSNPPFPPTAYKAWRTWWSYNTVHPGYCGEFYPWGDIDAFRPEGKTTDGYSPFVVVEEDHRKYYACCGEGWEDKAAYKVGLSWLHICKDCAIKKGFCW